jgi:tellurite resistance protein
MTKIETLYNEYSEVRFIELNKEQFIYLVNLFPALRVVQSDGIVDHEEWTTVKRLAKILGNEFASEDLGEEKEENLMLIYKSEFRYLIKSLDQWEVKFLAALKEYFDKNDASKEFVLETMYLFAHASDGVSTEENATIEYLTKELGLEDTVI